MQSPVILLYTSISKSMRLKAAIPARMPWLTFLVGAFVLEVDEKAPNVSEYLNPEFTKNTRRRKGTKGRREGTRGSDRDGLWKRRG
jgi:hypothetical protein